MALLPSLDIYDDGMEAVEYSLPKVGELRAMVRKNKSVADGPLRHTVPIGSVQFDPAYLLLLPRTGSARLDAGAKVVEVVNGGPVVGDTWWLVGLSEPK